MPNKFYIVILITSFLCSCTEYTPKPLAYARIDRVESKNKVYKNNKFSFEYSDSAIIDSLSESESNQIWLNLVYPQYSARIYCTYFPITNDDLRMAAEDSHRLVYSHSMKAQQIGQTQFADESNNIYGILYDIEGDVAVPEQFFLTDSVSHFFRGSLYYDSIYNVDSILPITNYLRDDIIHLIESFKWNNK